MPEKPPTPKSIGEWLGDALGVKLPPLPKTLNNLDAVAAALLDVPTAWLETKAGSIRKSAARDEQLANALTRAMKKRLGETCPSVIETRIDGMVADYIQKQSNRDQVFEATLDDIVSDPPAEDAQSQISDDWIAYFKGKVDNLGEEEARTLFGKVLSGEIRQPGTFSKRALNILSEMDQSTGELFDLLCGMSCSGAPLLDDVRVLTLGLGQAGQNSLRPFGLSFHNLNILQEAGLIIPDYNSYAGRPHAVYGFPMEIGGRKHSVQPQKGKFGTPDEALKAVTKLHGVAFTIAACELRQIVALKPNRNYLARLTASFDELGFILRPISETE